MLTPLWAMDEDKGKEIVNSSFPSGVPGEDLDDDFDAGGRN